MAIRKTIIIAGHHHSTSAHSHTAITRAPKKSRNGARATAEEFGKAGLADESFDPPCATRVKPDLLRRFRNGSDWNEDLP